MTGEKKKRYIYLSLFCQKKCNCIANFFGVGDEKQYNDNNIYKLKQKINRYLFSLERKKGKRLEIKIYIF